MKQTIEKSDAEGKYRLHPVICGLSKASIKDIAKIELLSDTPPWGENLFSEEFTNEYAHFFGARLEGKLIGFLLLHFINDEAHVLKFGVLPEYRGKGVGEALITNVLFELYSGACKWITLEVRKNNYVAKKLYEKLGFYEVGIREAYYTDNKEDALVLSLSLAHFVDLYGQESLPENPGLEKGRALDFF